MIQVVTAPMALRLAVPASLVLVLVLVLIMQSSHFLFIGDAMGTTGSVIRSSYTHASGSLAR
jgi:hypothetical protein